MLVFTRLRKLTEQLLYRLSSQIALLALFVFLISSWIGLWLANEQDLLAADTFFYWLLVTASTVGYGDHSPTTPEGRLFTALWIIPLGLSLFALVVTRVGIFINQLLFKGRRGLLMLNHKDHTLIIGWNGARTLRLIELLLAQQSSPKEPLVLVVNEEMENPKPDLIDFVRVTSYTDTKDMERSAIAKAKRIIIDTVQDDLTVTTALFCAAVNPEAHKTAYLQQESLAGLLKTHCPRVEIIPSVSVEMLARSTLDPGSSQLHKQLLDSTEGTTQYSLAYEGPERPLAEIFNYLKQSCEATLIALKDKTRQQIEINPSLDRTITSGDQIFYIANHRLSMKDLQL